MRLLLVEDSDDLRRLFARVLTANGFEVRQATDGCDALEALAGFEPEVVVTDLMMPRMDGFELIRRLRTMPETRDVPILAISAAASTEAEREVRSAGVVDLLAKPLDAGTLIGRLDRLRP